MTAERDARGPVTVAMVLSIVAAMVAAVMMTDERHPTSAAVLLGQGSPESVHTIQRSLDAVHETTWG